MILQGPPRSGIPRGAVRDQVVELRDVMPTLLDCAGLPVPAIGGGTQPPAPGAWGGCGLARTTFTASTPLSTSPCSGSPTATEKYVWFSGSGHEQLFDLDDDPQELRDLARQPGNEARVRLWRARLIEELHGREEGFTDGARLIPGRPVQPCLSHIRGGTHT